MPRVWITVSSSQDLKARSGTQKPLYDGPLCGVHLGPVNVRLWNGGKSPIDAAIILWEQLSNAVHDELSVRAQLLTSDMSVLR